MSISGIYKIQSIIKPNRIYVGSASDFYRRKRAHLFYLNLNKHSNQKLQNHYNKYGKSDLLFSILISCDQEKLLSHEQFFIDTLSPYFNILKVAGSNFGYRFKVSPKRYEQLKIQNKGRKMSDETKIKMSIAKRGRPSPNQGKKMSQDQKMKISNANIGKPAWNKGKKATSEACMHQSMGHLGKKRPPFSEETKQKMRKPKSPDHRQKIINALTGRRASLKTREKQSRIAKQRFRNREIPMPLNIVL
jgi:group I intron endonuclease